MTTASEPAWLRAARAKLGTREAPGKANSPTIMGWIKRLGTKVLGTIVNDDATPWCGTFVAVCMQEAGISPASIAVRAKSWATWGANLRTTHLAPGAVLVFEREGGGHVGLYVGQDATHYYVLGGNQGDAVSIARIARNRLIASRWPKGVPVTGGPITMAANGAATSHNEA